MPLVPTMPPHDPLTHDVDLAAWDDAAMDGYILRTYRLRARSLDEVRARRLAAAKERRQVERDRGVVIDGRRWHSDEASCAAIATAVTMAQIYEAAHGPGSFVAGWKTADGFVPVDLAGLVSAGLQVGLHVQVCFAAEAALVSAIVAAETIEEVLAVDIGAGWPG